MKLMELFDSRDKKKRISHIRNLVALAFADGSVDQSEIILISAIALRSGLTGGEVDRIMQRPDSVKFAAPETTRERIEQLYDMVLVMTVDCDIHENELALCKLIALKLGFSHQIIDAIVYKVIESIAAGINSELAITQLVKSA